MNMSVNRAAASHASHARPANFGRLNSAIARGDLDAAQTALSALNTSDSPSALAAKAKGSLDAVGAAIATGDVAATRSALAAFRTSRSVPAAPEAAAPVPVPPPAEEVIALITGAEPIDSRPT